MRRGFDYTRRRVGPGDMVSTFRLNLLGSRIKNSTAIDVSRRRARDHCCFTFQLSIENCPAWTIRAVVALFYH